MSDRLTRAADPGFVWPAVAAGPQSGPGALPVGSPGKVGVLDLAFRRDGCDPDGRTVLAERFQKSPLQVMRSPRCVMLAKRTPKARSCRWSTHCVSSRPSQAMDNMPCANTSDRPARFA